MSTGEPGRVNVLCLKWGTGYPALYANRLYAGVRKHLHRPFRFVCVTDDPTGLDEGIEAVAFPGDPHVLNRPWPNIFVKLLLFQDGFANLVGPTLFLDMDIVIMDDLDRFFGFAPGENCIVHNWVEWRKRIFRARPHIGNSSVFRFEAGKSGYVHEAFLREKGNPELAWIFQKGSQKFQTRAMEANGSTVRWWPDDFVKSFKFDCRPVFPFNLFLAPRKPKDGSVIAFHGHPDPEQACAGFRDGHLNTWTRPAKWVGDLWTGR
jgi:hypothetical protein